MNDVTRPNFDLNEIEPIQTAQNALEGTQVSRSPAFMCGRPIGEILKVSAGLTEEKLQEALAVQAEKGGRLGEVLVGMRAVSEEDVARALGAQLDLPYLARIFVDEIDAELVQRFRSTSPSRRACCPSGSRTT